MFPTLARPDCGLVSNSSRATFARAVGVLALVAASVTDAAFGQCPPAWSEGFSRLQVQRPIEASVVFDDGTGPALFYAIEADINGVAGVQKWDGTRITGIGSIMGNPFGNPGYVHSMCVFDDGSGPALYVAGFFFQAGNIDADGVARWSPSSGWSAVGTLVYVNGLAVFDDGTGAALYATGQWPLLSRWNGSTWIDVGQVTGGTNEGEHVLVHDDGTGPALYVGGTFTIPGMASANVARFDGNAWSALGTGTDNSVLALGVHDTGSGQQLYAAGLFTHADGSPAARIARWDGTSWSALGAGLSSWPDAVLSFDDGTGSALYACGNFSTAGGGPANHIARWNGATWSTLGSGLDFRAQTLCPWDDGTGVALFAGGTFTHAGDVLTPYLAKWKSTGWSEFAPGNGLDDVADALVVHDDGSGPALYCGGAFQVAGNKAIKSIARWDGTSWSALGAGLSYPNLPGPEVFALASWNDGSGNGARLYAGGRFDLFGAPAAGIAVWDGSLWTSLGGAALGTSGQVYALCVFDDGSGPALYAGGNFNQLGAGLTRYIARWNGTSWSDVGGGMQQSTDTLFRGVRAMAVYDDGSGPALYVGGAFPSAGGTAGTASLARWKNGAWSSVGGAMGRVLALTVTDVGNGPKLYLGGDFNALGGVPALRAGSFDAAGFAGLSGFNDMSCIVRSLAAYDDGFGGGPRLYAGGRLRTVGGLTECSVARLDGTAFSPVVTSLGGTVFGMLQHDDGHGPALFACGSAVQFGNVLSTHFARYAPDCPDPVGFCFGTASACPCGNAGAAGNGCASSIQPNGAHLSTTGMASLSADTLVLAGTGTSNSVVTYFQGTQRVNGGAGAVFGDGLRCAGGSVVRIAAVPATGGASQYPLAGNLPVSVRGQVTQPGSTHSYQAWYRNAGAFCTPSTFNLSNGVEVTWGL